MGAVTMSEARDHFADLANRVAFGGERLMVRRRGKNLVALVPAEDLELLERLEDKLDLRAIRERAGEKTIPWEKLRKNLGL